MKAQKATLFRLLAVLTIAVAQIALPRPAIADPSSPCNTFCWTACNEVQGAWCTGSCGNAGLICAWGSPCSSVGLYTVNCWKWET